MLNNIDLKKIVKKSGHAHLFNTRPLGFLLVSRRASLPLHMADILNGENLSTISNKGKKSSEFFALVIF